MGEAFVLSVGILQMTKIMMTNDYGPKPKGYEVHITLFKISLDRLMKILKKLFYGDK